MADDDLPEGLPDDLRPRLRVFMSADVVGSTALKQPDVDGADAVDWLLIFEQFYQIVAQGLEGKWNALRERQKSDRERQRYFGDPPVFWKTIGDEIVFYKDLTDSRQIHACILCWLDALSAVRGFFDTYRQRLADQGMQPLDVKSAVWTAGFPRRNKQVIVRGAPGTAIGNMLGVERAAAQQYDFIGPGIDIGFRIASFATQQKMIVSLDVAYILSLRRPDAVDCDAGTSIYYDGRFALKGVFDNKRYPIFWIDNARQGSFDSEEVQIQHPLKSDDIVRICRKYYNEEEHYSKFTHVPFIWADPAEDLERVPDKFLQWLHDANDKYQRTRQGEMEARQEIDAPLPELDRTSARRNVPKDAARLILQDAGALNPEPPREQP